MCGVWWEEQLGFPLHLAFLSQHPARVRLRLLCLGSFELQELKYGALITFKGVFED